MVKLSVNPLLQWWWVTRGCKWIHFLNRHNCGMAFDIFTALAVGLAVAFARSQAMVCPANAFITQSRSHFDAVCVCDTNTQCSGSLCRRGSAKELASFSDKVWGFVSHFAVAAV